MSARRVDELGACPQPRSSAATAGSRSAFCSGARRHQPQKPGRTARHRGAASTVARGSPAGAGTPSAASEPRNACPVSGGALGRSAIRLPVVASQTFLFLSWWPYPRHGEHDAGHHRRFSTGSAARPWYSSASPPRPASRVPRRVSRQLGCEPPPAGLAGRAACALAARLRPLRRSLASHEFITGTGSWASL
jgi:hypothetical protein